MHDSFAASWLCARRVASASIRGTHLLCSAVVIDARGVEEDGPDVEELLGLVDSPLDRVDRQHDVLVPAPPESRTDTSRREILSRARGADVGPGRELGRGGKCRRDRVVQVARPVKRSYGAARGVSSISPRADLTGHGHKLGGGLFLGRLDRGLSRGMPGGAHRHMSAVRHRCMVQRAHTGSSWMALRRGHI